MDEQHQPLPEIPREAPGGVPTDAPMAPGGLAGERADEPRSGHKRGFFAELPVLIIIAFVLALVLKTFLVQAFYIPSSSMEPTLQVGDRVLVNKLAYTFREPRRGEVVVFSVGSGVPADEPANPVARFLRGLASGLGMAPASERDFIKRIIGLPGETIEMRNGVVMVDGEALDEAPAQEGGYLSARHLEPFGPFTVPDGHYFMMGDNRPNSSDSRYSLGPIPREQIIGRAFVIIWPVGSLGLLPIADYGSLNEEGEQALRGLRPAA